MKKNTFYIVTLISSFLISSASFALDDEDPELSALMGNLGVYSPKRPATNPRPDCACRKSPQRSNSAPFAPISKKEDNSDAVQDDSDIVPLQHLSPEPMAIGLPVLSPALEDYLMQDFPVENASPGLENTPPKKRTHLNASVLEHGAPDALSSASSKQSPLRPKNLFADDEDASPKVNRGVKRNVVVVADADADDDDDDDDFGAETFSRRRPLPHQKNAGSKRGRR